MKYQQWSIPELPAGAVDRLTGAGYPYLVSSVLASRGITTPEEAAAFLERDRDLPYSPFLMKDMDKAAQRVSRALAGGEKIAVFGDYDVDGITATVILVDYLLSRGGDVVHYIPRRIEDGYGLGKDAILSLHGQGVRLLVTVDCGITGVEEVAYANSLGMDVVVTDHHECKEELPPACAVVDPHRPDCGYPFKHLAGCGVALKLVLALGGESREEALLSRYCTLAAIGTVADVMQMSGENRTIVSRGLASISRSDFIGLHALLHEAGLSDKTVTSVQIGFVLAPRINAAGRMGAADMAADLLLCTDPHRAEHLARELCALNRERQAVEQEIYSQAVEQIEETPPQERSALVLASDTWHQGVVGIVASRLAERFSCPTFMICLQDGRGKGSCRSFGGFNLFKALESCAELLEGFGGHALAAGFTILAEHIDAFRERMERCVEAWSGGAELVSVLDVDAELPDPDLLTVEEVLGLDALEPYGAGNPKPVFCLSGCTVSACADVGGGRHLKLKLSRGGRTLDAIFFSSTAAAAGVAAGDRVDVAFTPQINEFRGARTVQLLVCDLRPAPTRMEAEQALYERLRRGESLTAQEAAALIPSRTEFVAVWRYLSGHARLGRVEDTARRLARSVARTYGIKETVMRTMVCLEVLDEHGLIQVEQSTDHLRISVQEVSGKVDLEASKLLRHLRRLAEEA